MYYPLRWAKTFTDIPICYYLIVPFTGFKTATLFGLVALVLMFATVPVTAQNEPSRAEEGTTDWLCQKYYQGDPVNPGDENYSQGEYSELVYLLRRVVAVLIVAAPLLGILVSLYATTAGLLSPSSGGDNYGERRRNAILLGFGAPLIAIIGATILNYLFGFSVWCVIPELPV